MSKYGNLAAALRSAIESGAYGAGERLPTTPELCEIYHVSNTTVKKALDELEQLGLIARRRGSGIFVKSTPSLRSGKTDKSFSQQMTGFTAEFAQTNVAVTSEVHDFTILHPNQIVAEALDISTEDFVYYICRVRLANNIPSNVEYTYMPLGLIPGLLEKHLYGSIYQYIEQDLGLKIGSAHRILRAVLPTTDEKEWLRLSPGDPLFEVRQVAYLDDGTPFEYSTTRHISSYKFYVVSTH